VKTLPFGANALLLDLGIAHLPDRAARTLAAGQALRSALPSADVVAGSGALLLAGIDPSLDLAPLLAAVQQAPPAPAEDEAPPLVLPVVYDGEDLPTIAALTGLDAAELVKFHTQNIYTVELLGFLPGFAYLGPVGGPLAVPRRATPRAAVPAGSVAVAGGFTGVYPQRSPGGWHLLGRAPTFRPYLPERDEPALRPGQRVRFEASDERALGEILVKEPAPAAGRGAALVVRQAPACATVQDRGRAGKLGLGLPPSGPLDRQTFDAANGALGNAAEAAAVEIPQGSLEVEAEGELWVSVDGEPPVRLAEGERLRVPPGVHAVRYLAVRGGVEVPRFQGSRSTLPSAGLGGLGGRALRRGDRLQAGSEEAARLVTGVLAAEPVPERLSLEPGPHLDQVGPEVLDILLREEFRVSRLGDRVGVRLEGPRLPARGRLERPVPMVRGAMEVTPDGGAIVLGPDHPVTGGYPVVAVLTPLAQIALARRWPGQTVRFAMARR
jgi:biotin-dependent carboxylase-like uncharacterized protein